MLYNLMVAVSTQVTLTDNVASTVCSFEMSKCNRWCNSRWHR